MRRLHSKCLTGKTAQLTDLQNAGNGTVVEQSDTLVERQFLIFCVFLAVCIRRVHVNIPFIARKRPEHNPALHGLGNAVILLLDPLKGNIFRNNFGTDVKKRVYLSGDSPV